MDAIIAVVVLAVPLLAIVFGWIRYQARLRAKGYAMFFVASAFFVVLVSCYALTYWVLIGATVTDAKNSSGARETVWLIATPLLWFLSIAAIAHVLPNRRARRISGKRRSVLPRVLAWSVTGIGAALSLFFLWELIVPTTIPRDQGVTALLETIAVSTALAGYWFAVDRRVTTAPTMLTAATGSVLYLRAFNAEQRPFVRGDLARLRRYTNQLKAHLPRGKGKRNNTIQLTLEDYLEEAITAKLGPFVGLGNPADDLPPDGAIREYAPDAQWQERLLTLVQDAKCIVIALGESANLDWELGQIKERGLANRLCLFTSPRLIDTDLGALNKALRGEAARRDELAIKWATICGTMRRVGYDCDSACPGPGAAVAFDHNGSSMVLTTEAITPDEYIGPVADWFNTGKKSGRYLAAACSECQAAIYQDSTSAVNGAGLCFSCQGKATIASLSRVDRLAERHPMLMTAWVVLSMVIAASIQIFLPTKSTWLYIALWLLVGTAPWTIQAGVRRLKRRKLAVRSEAESPLSE